MENSLIQQREVLVFNQPKQKHHVFKTATNKWSELAALIESTPELEVEDVEKMRAVVFDTKNTLELPDAEIPAGPQRIFLFEAKVKSGAKVKEESLYTKLSYNELRRLAKDKGITGLGSNPTRDELVTEIEKVSGTTVRSEKRSTKTGKTRTVTTREKTSDAKDIENRDREFLKNQPSLDDRVAALENAFANYINSMYAACKDFVAPSGAEASVEALKAAESKKDEPKTLGNFSLDDLKAQAEGLRIK